MSANQSNSEAKITTPLGDDVLLLRNMTMTEELGRLFSIDLDLLSEQGDIKFEDILAKNVTIEHKLISGDLRYFNGIVTSFSQTGDDGSYAVYQATVKPWLWFLTRTADCRIFQEMSVPDIVKDVFRGSGYTDFEDKLTKNYRTWEYCVQYRETDFNFVSRLLEQEGIYYYFTHENGKHNLVLSDGEVAHDPLPSDSVIDYYPPDSTAIRKKDHIYSWIITKEVQPGKYELNEFDFKKPKSQLETKSQIIRKHIVADSEIYDYPGEYTETDDGEKYVQARIEELGCQYEQAKGQSSVRELTTGYKFTLKGYTRKDQNREYLITTAWHSIHSDVHGTEAGSGGDPYNNSFTVIEINTPFRAARKTPKPIVQGAQTAIVVGPSGEEIYTDEYGRVKIKFHWDRDVDKDENSSCWVRVSQIWAGKKWGGMHIPRIGQEVIVDFMEGDPDRPIITGRVYNADQMPPYDLPANKTQSGIKSRSSKGGSKDNFNEIRMEDKKGEEQFYIHAEKNQDNVVENNETTTVGRNRTEIVGDAKDGGNEIVTINGDKTEDVKAKGKAKGDRVRTVENDETVDIGKNLHITAGSEIVLQTGASSITMTSGGDITIEGVTITIDAKGINTVKSVAGTNIESAAITVVNGSLVQIN